ncbi:hypothetical protein EUGRSUZ_B02966, partial [Eucalyptus grandis]
DVRAVIDALALTRIHGISSAQHQGPHESHTAHPAERRSALLWKPPDRGYLKCNIDASHQPGSHEGNVACISRNHQGILTDVYTRRCPAASPFQAEVQALASALNHLLHQGLNMANIIIESDCLAMLEILHEKQSPPWKERALFAEISHLLSLCPNFSLQYCKREANGVADWAAKAHGRSDMVHNWNIFPPLILQNL